MLPFPTAEMMMGRRRIGQERLSIASGTARTSLDEISALVDWAAIDRQLAGVYAAAKGEPAWPPLALFRALLLAVWHDLSDVKLAEALQDRASFRRFCGFSSTESTPERTAFVRFRAELVRRGLDRTLFQAVTGQLEAKGAVQTGTLIDATLIGSASISERIMVAPAAGRAPCKPRSGVEQKRSRVCGDIMPRCSACAPASRRCSAPANAAMACGACAGSVWPGRGCRSD
jgi:IS5 family transposase